LREGRRLAGVATASFGAAVVAVVAPAVAVAVVPAVAVAVVVAVVVAFEEGPEVSADSVVVAAVARGD